MAKSSNPPPVALFSFYRPHDREKTRYTGLLLDPATGELKRPPEMTKQSFVAECDINNIIKQYKQTGMVRHISAKAQAGAYLDLPDEVDFQVALNLVNSAEASFATLPAKVRDRFHNSPAEFLQFMSDPNNVEEMIALGLATKAPDPAPAPGPAPAPAPSPSPAPEGGSGG